MLHALPISIVLIWSPEWHLKSDENDEQYNSKFSLKYKFGIPDLEPLLVSDMNLPTAAVSRTNEPQTFLCHVTGFSCISQDSNGTGLVETCVSHQRGLIPGCQEGSERLPRESCLQPSHQIPWWHPELNDDSLRDISVAADKKLELRCTQLHSPCPLQPAVVPELTEGWRKLYSQKHHHASSSPQLYYTDRSNDDADM